MGANGGSAGLFSTFGPELKVAAGLQITVDRPQCRGESVGPGGEASWGDLLAAFPLLFPHGFEDVTFLEFRGKAIPRRASPLDDGLAA